MLDLLRDMLKNPIQSDFPSVAHHGASKYGKRIIKTFRRNGRIYELHATKGWRSYRDPSAKEDA